LLELEKPLLITNLLIRCLEQPQIERSSHDNNARAALTTLRKLRQGNASWPMDTSTEQLIIVVLQITPTGTDDTEDDTADDTADDTNYDTTDDNKDATANFIGKLYS